MITPYEQSDIIHIMRMNHLALSYSDTAHLEFSGAGEANNCLVKILAVENEPQIIIKQNGTIVCLETVRSVDDLKIFLEERLYQYLKA